MPIYEMLFEIHG